MTSTAVSGDSGGEHGRGTSLLNGRVADVATLREAVVHVCSTACKPDGFAGAHRKVSVHLAPRLRQNARQACAARHDFLANGLEPDDAPLRVHSSPCAECTRRGSAAGSEPFANAMRRAERASGMSGNEGSVTLFDPSTCATRQ